MSLIVKHLRAPVVLALLATAACSSTTPASFGENTEVANVTDNFQFQTSNVQQGTTTLTYTWRNNGTRASINQATTITAGTITLRVQDASGAQVYTRSLGENGTFQTSAGTAGDWTITLTAQSYSGTVNFRAQRL